MAWIYLLIAGVLEIGFTTLLRYIHGLHQVGLIVAFLFVTVLGFYFLLLSTRAIPMGTAYAIWTGIGAFGTAIVGIYVYGEPAGALRIVFLTALIGSIIGLKYVSPE